MSAVSTAPGRKSTPPRPRGRENAKNTSCRNIGIYGFCKYENDGCAYNHDSKPKGPTINPGAVTILPRNPPHESAKRFNVESPSFTPLQPHSNGKTSAMSPKAAHAAPFTPKSNKSSMYISYACHNHN
jgi:PAB-dependent poly(A)-specific ribonuclease subunit 3